MQQQGRQYYRPMPWRDDTRPYYILVSELMLQQTQVARVIPKFQAFIAAFPDEASLADAPLADVLRLWTGLGYNRRARYLHQAAQAASPDLPSDMTSLLQLPGVGPSTAGAILTYAYNQYTPFIETNVRTVYIHHFFANQSQVTDKQLRHLLDKTVDRQQPRQFYWALMDYGHYLKQHGYGRLSQSNRYTKQTAFRGSLREMRGQLIRILAEEPKTHRQLKQLVQYDNRFEPALQGLLRDQLVTKAPEYYTLAK